MNRAMHIAQVSIEHVCLTSEKPFDEVVSAFLGRLGKFEAVVYKDLMSGSDPQAVRARIQSMVGPSGFMLFGTNDHGALLQIVGRPRKAVQCTLGNPLFAIEMTRHDLRAALYAPLRVLIYEEQDRTCLEYDKPSSLVGQFGNQAVNETGILLDRKLAELAEEALR